MWEALGKSPNAGQVATSSSEHTSSRSSPLQWGLLSLLVPLGKCQWCKLGGSLSCLHTGHAQKLLQDTDACIPSRASKTRISGKRSVCSLYSYELPVILEHSKGWRLLSQREGRFSVPGIIFSILRSRSPASGFKVMYYLALNVKYRE